MDDRQAKLVYEAARNFAEAVTTINSTGSNHHAQDRLARLTRSFVEEVVRNLEIRAKSDGGASQERAEQALPEQNRRRQEAIQTLAEESTEAYEGFLGALFSYKAAAEGDSFSV